MVFKKLNNIAQNINAFCMDKLIVNHPSEDHQKLLNLTIIFLGGRPHWEVSVRAPKAFNHAV